MELLDPTTFEKWVQPHSLEWYKQLSNLQGKYVYPWNSTLSEPNGESVFDHEVTLMVGNKKVLDVGCGDGEYTKKWSLIANEITGFDVTEKFIQTGMKSHMPNVSFVIGNIKNGLPFTKDEFDCAYIRKGPTSAYPYLKDILKKGGKILGIHPGDESNKELPLLFPNLFEHSTGTPILDSINQRLAKSNFPDINIETINSIEYLKSPIDVLKMRCFGQIPSVLETLKQKSLSDISRIFEEHVTENGLPITHSRYLVRATV